MPRAVSIPTVTIMVLFTIVLSACQSTTPIPAQTAARPTPVSQSAPSSAVVQPPYDVLSPKPPAATLDIQGMTQTAGIATYCWRDGTTGTCADAGGIATPHDPLEIASPVTATLTLPLTTPPSTVQWEVTLVTDQDAQPGTAQNARWWTVYQTDAIRYLPLEREQTITWSAEPGLYVVRVLAAWQDVGDVTYGFLLDVQ